MTGTPVPFLSLQPGEDAADVRAAIERVLTSGWFILGPEVEAFEAEFARASGAAHAVGVANGTDAIALILRALGIGHGDTVVTSPLSAAYSALAVMMVGARPLFADIDPVRLTLDPNAVEAAIDPRTKAILPVHLYGQAADLSALADVASRHGLALVEVCGLAHLATAADRPVGTVGVAGAFSFYPTKNLAALGDGGAVITRDPALAGAIKRLRNGGQTGRYHHASFGVNSRLDEIQAAILRARLPRLARWTARRRALAERYRQRLADAGVVVPPPIDPGHVYHLFVIRSGNRDALQEGLRVRDIETLIHYPVPIPRQPALAGESPSACPQADRACAEVLSLPLYPALRESDLDHIAAAVCAVTRGQPECAR